MLDAAIDEYDVVFTGELDDYSLSHDVSTTNAARASRPGLAGDFFDLGPGYALLLVGVSYADVYVVSS